MQGRKRTYREGKQQIDLPIGCGAIDVDPRPAEALVYCTNAEAMYKNDDNHDQGAENNFKNRVGSRKFHRVIQFLLTQRERVHLRASLRNAARPSLSKSDFLKKVDRARQGRRVASPWY
jgi:hypothetical protein